MKQERLIILDRDGVINHDSDDYIKSPDEWLPIEGSLKAIAQLNQAGFKVGIATNQSGISRGYFDQITLTMMHKKMEMLLAEVGGHIDAIEICTDHPNNPGPSRKPAPGMVNKLLKLFNADPKQTWFVGDSLSDIQCAKAAGCKPALALTGKGQRTLEKLDNRHEILIVNDLKDFCQQILTENSQ